MGLFLAKEYLKGETKICGSDIPLQYNDTIHMLKKNERYICPDDRYIEVMYTGDELKITYGNKTRLMFNSINGTLLFTIISSNQKSDNKQHTIYPLTMVFSRIRIIHYTEEEYEESTGTIMARYLEYRD